MVKLKGNLCGYYSLYFGNKGVPILILGKIYYWSVYLRYALTTWGVVGWLTFLIDLPF